MPEPASVLQAGAAMVNCPYPPDHVFEENEAAMRTYLICLLACLPAMPALAQEYTDQPVMRAAVDADGKQRVSILGGSYFFKPDHIVVKVNVPVELAVRLEPGIVPH